MIYLDILTIPNPNIYFDYSNLTTLTIDSIVFWDEKYYKVGISGSALSSRET